MPPGSSYSKAGARPLTFNRLPAKRKAVFLILRERPTSVRKVLNVEVSFDVLGFCPHYLHKYLHARNRAALSFEESAHRL